MSAKTLSEGVNLKFYDEEVYRLKELGRKWKLTDSEIEFTFVKSLNCIKQNDRSRNPLIYLNSSKKKKYIYISFTKLILILLLLLSSVQLGLINYKSSYNFVVRNVQELIYPCMKLLRYVTLPIVKLFPSITVWYDELCLFENPLFQPPDINCWPCEEVRNVLDLSDVKDLNEFQSYSAIPFTVKDAVQAVEYSEIENMYKLYSAVFDRDAPKIESAEPHWSNARELMLHKLEHNPSENKDTHITWRINRLNPARIIRKLFQRPQFIPSYINVERFLFIDEPRAKPYILPFPESYRVFIMQGTGERLIVLEPVKLCSQNCSRVSVILEPSDVLSFNIWFYTAKSYPIINSTKISISCMVSH